MNKYEIIRALNQLLGVVCRSLPAYLADAHPWSRMGSWEIQKAFDRLTTDQRMYARRAAEEIETLGEPPDYGAFPVEFTGKNDLDAQFLLGEVIDCLERDAALVERLAGRLETASAQHALALEILGNIKGHADVLKRLQRNLTL